MKENGRGSVLAARRGAIDTDAGDVIPGIFGGDGFVPENTVGETGVFEVFPANVVEGFGTIRCAHAIDLHNDKAEISQRGEAAGAAEGLRDVRSLGASVDLFEDRIFFVGVEIF